MSAVGTSLAALARRVTLGWDVRLDCGKFTTRGLRSDFSIEFEANLKFCLRHRKKFVESARLS